MNWTESQKQAIDKRGKNIIVSAAAGSGKTAVLTQRIVDLVKNDGFDISNMLILTFTNAAANEMRSRIQKKLYEILANSKENIHIMEQIQLVPQATISTMHSFCINLVRENFQYINIDPNFKIADNATVDMLKKEAMQEMMEDIYNQGEKEVLNVIDVFSRKNDDSAVLDEILNIHNFIQSKKQPLKWLNEKASLYNMTIDEFENGIYIQEVKNDINEVIEKTEKNLNIIKKISDENELAYSKTLNTDIENAQYMKQLLEKDFDSFVDFVKDFKYPRLPSEKKADKEITSMVKQMRDNLVKKYGFDMILGYDTKIKDYHSQMQKMYKSISVIVKMVENFDQRYKQKKLENNLADFNDLEHYAIEILEDESIRKKISDRYTHIFYDEYQDSNEVQDYIIQSIAKEDNLFFVGDVKQSIYGFRLAEPRIFKQRLSDYKNDEKSCNINLSQNFRSSRQVIDFCNKIFENIMTEEISNIDYRDGNYLYTKDQTEYDSEKIQINHFRVENESNLSEDDPLAEMEKQELRAEITAKQVLNLVREKNADFKDITIVSRSLKNSAPFYKKIFKNYNIPLFIDYSESVFQLLEVSVFVDLLKIIDNIRWDRPLLSVLLSEIGNFEISEINQIKSSNPKEKFFHKIFLDYAYNMEDELSEKMRKFITQINYFAKIERYQDLDDFIDMVFDSTGYEDFVKTMPQGNIRVKNLDIIRKTAKDFMQRENKSLHYFIIHLENIFENESDSMDVKNISDEQNIVRLMTIHKSKGLEFDTVIVNDIDKYFNLTSKSRIVMDKKYGIGIDYIDFEKHYSIPTIAKKVINSQNVKQSIAEEIRILYVALTRAKKSIILNSLEKESKNSNYKYLETEENIKSGFFPKNPENIKNYRDFIIYALRDDIKNETDSNGLYKKNEIDVSDYLKQDICEKNLKEEFEKTLSSIEINQQEKEEIEKKYRFKYQYMDDIDKAVKNTVTGLGRQENEKMIEYLKDYFEFSDKKKNDAGYIGTLTHSVMEHIDFSSVQTKDDIIKLIDNLAKDEIIENDEKMLVDVQSIYKFLSSELGQRIKKAKKVYKEESFIQKHEGAMLNGVIDLFFEEEDYIVLVDYKTDRFKKEDIEEHSKRHIFQIEKYKNTIEEIFKKEVKQSYIYYLSINQAYEVR